MLAKILKEQEKSGLYMEMEWKIRPLPSETSEALTPLHHEIFHESPPRWIFLQSQYQGWGAYLNGILLGFKLGYMPHPTTFYSVRGGVHPRFRRQGVARALLHAMILDAHGLGCTRFQFHCFPYLYPGMFELGTSYGFAPIERNYDAFKKTESVLMSSSISSLISKNQLL